MTSDNLGFLLTGCERLGPRGWNASDAFLTTGRLAFGVPTVAKKALNGVVDYLVAPSYADARVQDWALVQWQPALIMTIAYVLAIWLGKIAMRNRKPFNVKPLVIGHNIILFSLSLYMTIETLRQAYINFGWGTKLHIWGNMTEPGSVFSDSGRRLATVIWIHYLSKAYEFLDTVIMLLKKNERQISFLHLYHHASTFFPCWWAAVNYAPGGDVYFICALNSGVHVFMYGYYLAASMGFKAPKAAKQSITIIQMVQFGLLNSQALYGVFWATFYRPRIVVVLALVQSVVFMTLFANFYRKAYSKKRA